MFVNRYSVTGVFGCIEGWTEELLPWLLPSPLTHPTPYPHAVTVNTNYISYLSLTYARFSIFSLTRLVFAWIMALAGLLDRHPPRASSQRCLQSHRSEQCPPRCWQVWAETYRVCPQATFLASCSPMPCVLTTLRNCWSLDNHGTLTCPALDQISQFF